jgi:hypothetical protein
MPEFVVGNTELGGGKLKKGKGFLKSNFELVPNWTGWRTYLGLTRARGQILRTTIYTDCRTSKGVVPGVVITAVVRRHLLEIVLGLSQKVISNYANHLADTPVDGAFEKFSGAA